MKLNLEQAKEQLLKAKARLADVQERGNEAISAYDLRMGYDAHFYLVRCPLLLNHVKYYEGIVKELTPKQLSLF